MGNFFGKPDYGPAEGAYSWQHLLFVSFLMTSMVLLAILSLGGHPVFYPMIVVVLFYLYIFGFVYVYNVIKNKKTKKQQA
jgi:hypothetical protein